MACRRGISVLLSIGILALAMQPVSAASEPSPGASAAENWVPARGVVAWTVDEFRCWLEGQDEGVQLEGERVLNILAEHQQPVLLVFLRPQYENWKSTIPPTKRQQIDALSLSTTLGSLNQATRDALSSHAVAQTPYDQEVVIVPTALAFCPICAKAVEIIISYLLGRFVLDPFVDAMIANWEKEDHCHECWYEIGEVTATVYERCIYCSHGELGLIRDYGTHAKTYCILCHAIVWIYNPLL